MSKVTLDNESRRNFLVRSVATAGGAYLSIGLGAGLMGEANAAIATSAYTPSIWFTITPDSKVTMHIVKTEMGQHIGTGLAQVIAEELEVKWEDVRLDSPLESVENFAIYGLAYTVNSGSMTTEFDRISRAGAAGRMALIDAAAGLLGASVKNCSASNSRVTDSVSGKSLSYGEILQRAKINRQFAYPNDFKNIPLKARGTYKIIGKSIPALDIPAKTNGSAKYAMDVFLPNMVYGALAMPRTRYASKALSVDDSEARKIPGFIKAVIVNDGFGKCTGWVVAIADRFPTAMKAAKALKVQWDSGPYANLDSAGLKTEYKELAKNESLGANWVLEGDVDKGFKSADKVLDVEYTTEMVVHATMEPLNATAQFVGDECHIYTGNQSQSFARMTLSAYLSKIMKIEAKVYIHQHLVGGGFGGKQDFDEILAATYCAHDVGRPVKLIQTRETNFATSFARTPTYHRMRAGLKNGQLTAVNHDIVSGWMGDRFAVGKKHGSDWLQLDSWDEKKQDIDQWSIGGSDHWYDMPNHRVRAWNHDKTTWAVQASALRTVSNSYNIFVVESMLDEIAHAAGRDPLDMRLAMLNGKGGNRGIPNTGYAPGTPSDYYLDRLWISLPWAKEDSWIPYESATVGGALRLANCLRVAAGKAGYGTKVLPPNTAMGVAVTAAEERQSPTWVATVAEVTVDPTTGIFKINRLTIAMDCGTIVNPVNVDAQIRASALWGAGQIMQEQLTLKDGAFVETNFDTYRPIRLADIPQIDVHLVPSEHHPSGVGEPASTTVAPAVANAIFKATGVRVRQMPLHAKTLLEGIRNKKA